MSYWNIFYETETSRFIFSLRYSASSCKFIHFLCRRVCIFYWCGSNLSFILCTIRLFLTEDHCINIIMSTISSHETICAFLDVQCVEFSHTTILGFYLLICKLFVLFTQILKDSTKISYDWSFYLAWTGVGFTLASAILFSGAAICLRGEREREEAVNMQYLMPGIVIVLFYLYLRVITYFFIFFSRSPSRLSSIRWKYVRELYK